MLERTTRVGAALAVALGLGACRIGGPDDAAPETGGAGAEAAGAAADRADEGTDGELQQLGQQLFHDPSLSLTRTQSCASCHQESTAFSGNNRADDPLFPVAAGDRPELLGARNVPTAMYMSFSPPFGFVQDEESGEPVPAGGQFWDGRAADLAAQAAAPFLNPREMAMPDERSVIERVQDASYAALFRRVFGADALDDADRAYAQLTQAIAAYEDTDAFHPFSSKFDAMLRGEVELDEHEQHGFELFKDPEQGNCIACHAGDDSSSDPHDWLFTDFTYDNLGVPRNREIPDNVDPEHHDLGLCKQPGIAQKVPDAVGDKGAFVAGLCGAFKVPTLRNVARTAPYMHNGYFAKLRDVVEFYVTRDTQPDKWYPRAADGSLDKWNDLPAEYKANVNTEEVPYDRQPGQAARLSPAEIDDVVAFLRTLSDGWNSAND